MPRFLWLAAPLLLSFLLPGSYPALLLVGYSLIAAIHKLTGIRLHPQWFRCVIWTGSAAVAAVLPIGGLAFFPLGALIAELRFKNRQRPVSSAEDGKPAPAWVAFSS